MIIQIRLVIRKRVGCPHGGLSENVVLFPYLGSATVRKRIETDVESHLAWAAGKSPLSQIRETPWLSKESG